MLIALTQRVLFSTQLLLAFWNFLDRVWYIKSAKIQILMNLTDRAKILCFIIDEKAKMVLTFVTFGGHS